MRNYQKGKLDAAPVDDLVLDPDLQMRAGGTNEEHVCDLMEALKKGAKLPRVKTRRVPDRGRLVVDGFHTVLAYKKANKKTVPVNERPGTWEEALVDAATANQQHLGLKRSAADKRRAVNLVLDAGVKWSARRIAQEVGVGDHLVAAVVADRTGAQTRTSEVEGRDGKTYKPTPRPRKAAKSLEGDWRAVPLAEFLKASDKVYASLEAAKVETAGDLYDRLTRGPQIQWVTESVASDLMDELRVMAKGAIPYPEGGAAPPPADEPTQGAAVFAWAAWEEPWGRAVRSIDAMLKSHPEQKGTITEQAFRRLSNEITKLVKGWRKGLEGKA